MSGDAPARSYWDYNSPPSFEAAIVFAVLYTIPCLVTIYQYVSLRCWFWVFMVIGSMMEVLGYVVRPISIKNPTEMVPYIVQFLPVLLAPAVIAASCYMAMGRVVLHVTPQKYQTAKTLWITPRWMTPFFVGADVLSFMIQIVGGAQVTSDDPKVLDRAFTMMKAGLGIQLLFFAFFLVIAMRFHFVARTFREQWPDNKWPKFLWVINIASLLIFIRSIYRMIEFTQGHGGYLLTHEWTFFVFESVMILPCIILFNVYHPAHYVTNTRFRQRKGEARLAIASHSDTELRLNPNRSAYP